MNILHVIRDLDSNTGGPVSAVFSISSMLASRGDAVTILSISLGKYDAPSLNNVEIVTVPCQFIKWRYSHAFKRVAEKLIEKSDLVHIHTVWEYPTFITAKLCDIIDKPYILRPCGMLDEWCMGQGGGLKKLYYKFMTKNIIKKSGGIHFTSKKEMDLSKKYLHGKYGFVLPIPINECLYSKREKTIKISCMKKKLLFVGRIHPHKRLELIFQVLGILKSRGITFVLDIAGEGKELYKNSLKDLSVNMGIDNCIDWKGRIKQKNLVTLYRQAYLTLLPSMHENYGNVLIEAMSQACPVVMTREVQISNEVVESGSGIIVDSNKKSFADTLECLMKDSNQRNVMAKNSIEYVHNFLSADNIYPKFKNIYSSLIKSPMDEK